MEHKIAMFTIVKRLKKVTKISTRKLYNKNKKTSEFEREPKRHSLSINTEIKISMSNNA